MADPFKTEENTLPEPHAEFAGVNRKDSFGKKAFAAMARLWRPRGSSMEPTSATVARYAMRLIDRKTGKAYSVDEMPIPESVLLSDGSNVLPGIFLDSLNAELPVDSGLSRSDWLGKALQTFEASIPPLNTYLAIGVWGDSVAPKTRYVMHELISRYGQGALGSKHVSGSDANGTSLTGGVDLLTSIGGSGVTEVNQVLVAGAYYPCSWYYHIPTTGTLAFTAPESWRTGGWTKLSIIYAKFGGGGSVTVNVTQNGTTAISSTIPSNDIIPQVAVANFTAGLSSTGNPTI